MTAAEREEERKMFDVEPVFHSLSPPSLPPPLSMAAAPAIAWPALALPWHGSARLSRSGTGTRSPGNKRRTEYESDSRCCNNAAQDCNS